MKKRPLCLACIGLMTAIFLMKLAGLPIFGEPAGTSLIEDAVKEETEIHVRGQISRREQKPNSVRYYLKNTILFFHNQEIPLNTIYLTVQSTEKYPVGAEILAAGVLDKPESGRNPGQFDARSYYACQKIFYFVWAENIRLLKAPALPAGEWMAQLRESLSEKVSLALPGGQAGILAAMLWGDRSLLEEDSRINYQFGGVSHILSISGLHISLMGLALYRFVRRLLPLRLPAAAAAAAVMLCYCLFTGAQAATIRAFLMFSVSLGAQLTGRSYDMLCALSLSGILILLKNPGMLFYSGFQLSFTAVIAVGVISPAAVSLLPKPGHRSGRLRRLTARFLETALSCGVVWAAALPLTAYYFYEIPLWSTLINLLMLPFMGGLMILGLAGSCAALFSLQAGRLLLYAPGLLLEIFESAMELLRRLPGGLLICGQPRLWQVSLCYAGIGLFVFWCRRRAEGKSVRKISPALPAAALLLCSLLFFRREPAFSLTALDVGQGDCLALQAGSVHFLVDGGSSSESQVGKYRILPYLKQQGIRRLEGIFITHPDADHINGIQELLQAIANGDTQLSVKRLFLPEWMQGREGTEALTRPAAAADVQVSYLRAGDLIRTGSCRIQVLYPKPGQTVPSGEENSASLVLAVHYKEMDFLLTGDLEGPGEEALADTLTACEYLKAAHHGSRNSTGEAFLEAAAPAVCVISAPENSVYGHPHRETLDRLRQAGTRIFCTSRCGAIRAVTDGQTIEVFTFLSEYDIL